MDPTSDEALLAEASRLRKEVAAKAQPILDEQLARGRAEFISAEQSYSGRKEDSSDICAIRYVPGSGMYRMSLSRDAYPELYAVKAQAEAMEKTVRERQQRAANAGK